MCKAVSLQTPVRNLASLLSSLRVIGSRSSGMEHSFGRAPLILRFSKFLITTVKCSHQYETYVMNIVGVFPREVRNQQVLRSM